MATALLLSGFPHITKHSPLRSIQPWRNNPFFPLPSSILRFTPLPLSSSLKPFKFSPVCSAKPPSNPKSKINSKDVHKNPIQAVLDSARYALAIALVSAGLMIMAAPMAAWAASGGRMGGRSFSSHSSSSAPSRSYSAGRASSAFSFDTPFYSPTPFGGRGFYAGSALGLGFGASSGFFYVLAGLAAFVLVSGFLSDRSEGGVLASTESVSVLKLQVGLLGNARSLQGDLNRIAETADTSTPEGLSYVLTEATLALLRHPDYCISAHSSSEVKKGIEEVERRFNQLSIEERGKFNEETLVNVNNIRRQRTSSSRASGFSNEYIVITILVAVEGVHKLPSINGSQDLKDALLKLGSIPSTRNRTMAVEVLWTPQDENDTLSERELVKDYPLLRPL